MAKATLGCMSRLIRVLTQNTWHGLNHSWPLLMPPVENPIAHWSRIRDLRNGLRLHKKPLRSALQIFCLQEMNPMSRLLPSLARDLSMSSDGFAINRGVSLGRLSYPPFLEEGLGMLWLGEWTNLRIRHDTLSGWAHEAQLLGSIPASFQLSERRGAQHIFGEFDGLKIEVLHTHLHHGPPEKKARARRLEELAALFEKSERAKTEAGFVADVSILCGDFNSDPDHPEMEFCESKGFTNLRSPAGAPKDDTWDPSRNSICKLSTDLAEDDVQAHWDRAPHKFDHILIKTSRPYTHQTQVAFNDGPGMGRIVSDHFGLLAEIEIS